EPSCVPAATSKMKIGCKNSSRRPAKGYIFKDEANRVKATGASSAARVHRPLSNRVPMPARAETSARPLSTGPRSGSADDEPKTSLIQLNAALMYHITPAADTGKRAKSKRQKFIMTLLLAVVLANSA